MFCSRSRELSCNKRMQKRLPALLISSRYAKTTSKAVGGFESTGGGQVI